MDSLAVSYAAELARLGIETSIVVPGAFTKGTNHFLHAGKPADQARADEYARGPTADLAAVALKGLAELEPPDADPADVAQAIVRVEQHSSPARLGAFASARQADFKANGQLHPIIIDDDGATRRGNRARRPKLLPFRKRLGSHFELHLVG
jgi:hypothetical protein